MELALGSGAVLTELDERERQPAGAVAHVVGDGGRRRVHPAGVVGAQRLGQAGDLAPGERREAPANLEGAGVDEARRPELAAPGERAREHALRTRAAAEAEGRSALVEVELVAVGGAVEAVDEVTHEPRGAGGEYDTTTIDAMTPTKRQKPRSAGIYARISLDRNGESLAPERQIEDARAEVERRGWTVVEVYSDRDTSAYKRNVTRPEYDRMMRDLRTGKIDAIVVWKLDRLIRRFTMISKVLEVLDDTSAELVSVQEPFIDTTSPMGKAVLGLMAGMAEQESQNISTRVKRQQEQARSNGKLQGGGTRPFGLTTDGSVIESEAAVVRECMKRVLSGESLRSIARDLNARRVKTPDAGQTRKKRGKEETYIVKGEWQSATLSQMLRSPRLAALVRHEDELLPGQWDAIITREEHLALLDALVTRSLGQRKDASRVHLLSGLITCGTCGCPMRHMWFTMSNGKRFTRYQCMRQPGHDNCGRIAITSKSVDEYVSERLFDFMAETRVRPLQSTSDLADVEHQLAADHAARKSLVHARFVEQSIEQDDFKPAKAALDDRIASAERRLDALRHQRAAESVLPPPDLTPWQHQHETTDQRETIERDRGVLAAWWADDATTPEQRQVVARDWIESVTIHPAKHRGGNKFDDDRVTITFASPVK